MEESKETQVELVLDYINEFGSITHLDAINELGVLRLASRISDLKKQGYTIESKMVNVLNRRGKTCRVKRYWLGGEAG